MRLFTVLAIATATFAGPPLGLTPTAQPVAPAAGPAHALTAFVTGYGSVMTKCKGCGDSDWCRHCVGTGQGHGGPSSTCSSCKGTGTCQECLEPEPITPGLHIVK